ncbi:MAG: hypothetical protein ACOC58_02135 [Chloroflexota bacterium]
MPRRKSDWSQAREDFLGAVEKPMSVEEREQWPDKACGKCKHFFASSVLGSAGGQCLVLKTGSSIKTDPPKFVTEGEANMQTDVRADASKCLYYEEMDLVDTDIAEAFDPRYSRHQRQIMK